MLMVANRLQILVDQNIDEFHSKARKNVDCMLYYLFFFKFHLSHLFLNSEDTIDDTPKNLASRNNS